MDLLKEYISAERGFVQMGFRLFKLHAECNPHIISQLHNSQVAKGSDLYRVDKSNKLCMVVAKGMLVNIRILSLIHI